jgi:coproporphyrinogen III oxidase
MIHFHKVWKRVCDSHPAIADHARMKKECDEYFFIKHRNEARGVGGIFFDYMDATDAAFAFVQTAGDAFAESYVPIVDRRKELAYTPEQRAFQEYRRGRYVEFNLVYDRGTVFGLKTDGRIESILMSLPPVVRYVYDYKPRAGSPEAELTEYWLKPKDWAGMAAE